MNLFTTGRVSEPACFGTAPASGIFNPEPAPAPGKRKKKFNFFKTDYELSKIRFNQGCGSGSAFIFPPGSGSGSRRINLSTKNWKNARKLLRTATLWSYFSVNLHKLQCFLLLSNILCFLQLRKTLWFFSSNLVKLDLDLDPDLHSEKLLDPDPYKVNADPQPWF